MLKSMCEAPAPTVSLRIAETITRDIFGISGTACTLPGERAQNFRLTKTGLDDDLVLRVAHPHDSGVPTCTQAAVLKHLHQYYADLPVPRLMTPISGSEIIGTWHQRQGEETLVRSVQLSTFLPGTSIDQYPVGDRLRHSIGELLANLHQALATFVSPPSGSTPWNLVDFSQLAPLIRDMPLVDTDIQKGLPSILAHIEHHGLPLLTSLPRQTLHNDFNPHNLLVASGEISGIIDFGDLVKAPRLQDLAIAASYHVDLDSNPLDGVSKLVSSYNEILPLSVSESGAIWDLMVARLLSVLAISQWRAAREPKNAPYLLRNVPRVLRSLRQLMDVGCEQTRVTIEGALS